MNISVIRCVGLHNSSTVTNVVPNLYLEFWHKCITAYKQNPSQMMLYITLGAFTLGVRDSSVESPNIMLVI
jgi:hypothetical protein